MREFEFDNNTLPGSLELAYIGDAVYDLYVRSYLVTRHGHVRDMHRAAIDMVCAGAQARALDRIESGLTEEENRVVRRARNAHQTPTKHANLADYHRATALEALIGYLFVTGRRDRMEELIYSILDAGRMT